MKTPEIIEQIIGDDSYGLVKGLNINSKIGDVRSVESDGECYESDSPLNNLQCYHKLLDDKDFSYKYVFYFEDSTDNIAEINLFLEFDNSLENNIPFEAFENILSDFKEFFTNKYGLIKTESDKSGKKIEDFFHFETQNSDPVIEIVLVEYVEDEADGEESTIEKSLKITWQKKL